MERKKDQRLTPSYRPKQSESTPPCQHACPNCGDIRGWIGIVAQAEKNGVPREQALESAWRTIADVNPFPASLGRICPHPCESHCNRGEKDEPLAINAMERFLGDFAIERRLELPGPGKTTRPESIGVIGAGPSGLSFAYQMRRRGYRVTVYDGREKPGGMLRYGIPDYRLPPAVLDAEIEKIADLGVVFVMNTAVGRELPLDELRDRHDRLYLGIGAQRGLRMNIAGEEGPGVLTAVDYLREVNEGQTPSLGSDVVVIGGGNSAIDAARTARRAGARVTLLYRRGVDEMPAHPAEIQEAIEESVNMLFLAAPLRVERSESGEPVALHAIRMRLEGKDASGRPRPVPMPESEFRISATGIVIAISQAPDLAGLEQCSELVDGDEMDDLLLSGGDVRGLGIAGNAIVQGRYAAEHLHRLLQDGEDARNITPGEEPAVINGTNIDFDTRPQKPAARPPVTTADRRLDDAALEVFGTLSEAEFLDEAGRCFSCGSCFGCERCFMYCTAGSFTRLVDAEPGRYFSLNLDACQECGKCVEVCPCGFLQLG